MAGYSGTPLHKKLGIREGMALYAIHPPRNYLQLLSIPAKFAKSPPKNGADFVHLFVKDAVALKRDLPRARAAIKPGGMIWVSWPKQAAKIETDVTGREVRDLALEGDLVDVKICAVSEIWSGLKLVVRRTLR